MKTKSKFKDIVVIEDRSEGVDIQYKDKHLYAGPMSILDIEDHEDRLTRMGVPYILVQAETTIETLDHIGSRFIRGYCLFADTKKKEEVSH